MKVCISVTKPPTYPKNIHVGWFAVSTANFDGVFHDLPEDAFFLFLALLLALLVLVLGLGVLQKTFLMDDLQRLVPVLGVLHGEGDGFLVSMRLLLKSKII